MFITLRGATFSFLLGLFVCFMLLPCNVYAKSWFSSLFPEKSYALDQISRPSQISFPVVFYLSIDHPGLIKTMEQVNTREILPENEQYLPIYIGYIKVDSLNHIVFVSKVDNILPIKQYVESIILNQQLNQKEGYFCSAEEPKFCAEKDAWSSVWVLLNDLYRGGVYVTAYTVGHEPDNYFVPNFKSRRAEAKQVASIYYPEQWPEFSNNLIGMKSFNKQAYGLPIYAQWWYGFDVSVVLEKGTVPANIKFPLIYYIRLTGKGALKYAPEDSIEEMDVPSYLGYLAVNDEYTWVFTRKSEFNTSIPGLVNWENSLKPTQATSVSGFFGSSITAPSHSWNGVGVFLAKLVSSGDYEIFAYSSGRPPSYNFNPSFSTQHKAGEYKNSIDSFSYIYDNEELFKEFELDGLERFNSILFYEFRWPERWQQGAFGPVLESPWP